MSARIRDPRTPDEWRMAAAWAEVLLEVDSARHYGLVTGGPPINVDRCVAVCARAKARGIEALEADKDAARAALFDQMIAPLEDTHVDVQKMLDALLAQSPAAQQYIAAIFYIPPGGAMPPEATHALGLGNRRGQGITVGLVVKPPYDVIADSILAAINMPPIQTPEAPASAPPLPITAS